ncbi:ADP-ribosylglycohydrolase [Verrucomicrobium sp. GAS474]|uniref:ADP-ribosylglycohydrolase family protein n=1 Tax=Verrucomicrobium sp. GAS474 TaxID=1882831 RepID=UPI00087AE0FD|nr:ADP-ribosylglycohydrolase family protein [Verrucomicrobium sp. GAS474]SDT94483.1 ADP-ribosylglycohydrolase [Verrucomicrobium sp. GAS474]
MSGWAPLKKLVEEEFSQSLEEGKERVAVEALRAAWKETEDEETLCAIHGRLLALPIRPDFPFTEPDDLAAIRALRSGEVSRLAPIPDDAVLLDKLHGAWLGRCAGCALGKPVEILGLGEKLESGGEPDLGLQSWQRIKGYLTSISADEWPLRDYFPASSPVGKASCLPSTREHIAFMESDDDIRYTVLGQRILLERGRDFGSAHVAGFWLNHLPYSHVCTAETQAYRNMVLRYDSFRNIPDIPRGRILDAETDWSWIAHHLNPYREWIGAQIRVDSYGYAAPGDPRLAAEFAWRDARISHVKNGLYGAMFCAAMIAAAFATDDVRAIVAAGLGEIPRTSRLHAELLQVVAICDRHGNDFARFEEVFAEVHSLLGHYHAVHTNNNAALCVVALLLGGGDFHRGITLAVMGGWDTDCNGATVGSVVGALCGARRAPSHWIDRLNDTLRSAIIGYDPVSIAECARRSLDVVHLLG